MSTGALFDPPRPGALIPGTCPLCASRELRTLPFRYTFRGRYLYGVTCAACTLVFIHPQPAAEEIKEMYSEEYFTECTVTQGAHGRGAYMEVAAQSGAERRRAALRLDRSLTRIRPERGRYLEIGCGPGQFLAEMRNLGWSAEGLEISAFAVRHARETLQLEVQLGAIEESSFPEGSFDAVFMGDVLEHLATPLASLRAIRGWLRPGAVIAIAVPSTMNLLAARLGLALYGMRGRWKTLRIPPYHLFEYTPRTLRALIEAAGFRCRSLRQSAVPIRKMGLRGSPVENAAKVLLQIPALATSRFLNLGGDRLLAIAEAAGGPSPHAQDPALIPASRP